MDQLRYSYHTVPVLGAHFTQNYQLPWTPQVEQLNACCPSLLLFIPIQL